MKTTFFLLFLFIPFCGFTQDTLFVHGAIMEDSTDLALVSKLTVKWNGKTFEKQTTNESGEFEVALPTKGVYLIIIESKKHMKKVLEIDCSSVPADSKGGYEIQIDVKLMKQIKGFDKNLLETPIGKGSYQSSTDNIEFNTDYTVQQKKLIEAEIQRLRAAKK